MPGHPANETVSIVALNVLPIAFKRNMSKLEKAFTPVAGSLQGVKSMLPLGGGKYGLVYRFNSKADADAFTKKVKAAKKERGFLGLLPKLPLFSVKQKTY